MLFESKLSEAFSKEVTTMSGFAAGNPSKVTPLKSKTNKAKIGQILTNELIDMSIMLGEGAVPMPTPTKQPAPAADPAMDIAADPALDPGATPKQAAPDVLKSPEPAAPAPEAGGNVLKSKGEGLPSGSDYSVDMANSQLTGVIDKWMDLAGNYAEGDQRHNFIEIGERLREIVGVLERDFCQTGTQKETTAPTEDLSIVSPQAGEDLNEQ